MLLVNILLHNIYRKLLRIIIKSTVLYWCSGVFHFINIKYNIIIKCCIYIADNLMKISIFSRRQTLSYNSFLIFSNLLSHHSNIFINAIHYFNRDYEDCILHTALITLYLASSQVPGIHNYLKLERFIVLVILEVL